MTFQSYFAPYATRSDRSKGRLFTEQEDPNRTFFQRDRDRIIHSAAFRALKYKTQVFVYHEGDFFRTRLTHSLEVAQITRSVCRQLRIDEDLGEAVALAHDFGHTPFGHAGEDALHELMAAYGGFDHNDQAIHILTSLESRYADFNGLNLSWESLEGIAKHNGPLTGPARVKQKPVPPFIAELDQKFQLDLDSFAGLEAQIAAICDDIAYNNHDIDDGLRAGLFTIDDLKDVPLVGPVFSHVMRQYPDLDSERLRHESIRRLINQMVGDLMTETQKRLADVQPQNVDDIRQASHAMAGFSEEMARYDKELKKFLHQRMYRHYRVNRMRLKTVRIIQDLFQLFFDKPVCLPVSWIEKYQALDIAGTAEKQKARMVADYIASMTDRRAMQEHRQLFNIYETD